MIRLAPRNNEDGPGIFHALPQTQVFRCQQRHSRTGQAEDLWVRLATTSSDLVGRLDGSPHTSGDAQTQQRTLQRGYNRAPWTLKISPISALSKSRRSISEADPGMGVNKSPDSQQCPTTTYSAVSPLPSPYTRTQETMAEIAVRMEQCSTKRGRDDE